MPTEPQNTPPPVALLGALMLTTLPCWEGAARAAPNDAPAAPAAAVKTPDAATARPLHHPAGAGADQYQLSGLAGGTEVQIKVHHAREIEARRAMRAVLRQMRRIHRKLTAGLRGSEITSLNHIGGSEEMVTSTETYGLITRALSLCRETHKAYDPTVLSFDYLWNFTRRPFVRPLPDEIKARLAIAGCEKVALKPGRRVRFLNPGLRLTLEDVVHGHALEVAAATLRGAGVTAFRVRIGRDVYVQGRNGTRHWYVAVHHPRDRTRIVAQLYLGSHAVATRSDSERFVMKAGKRYHDILDPRTGRPARGVVQATVISTDPVAAGALSRAVFVLGARKGLALIATVPNAEAFVIDTRGRVHASRGMPDFARLPGSVSL